jgi:hypothetical protein
MKTVGDVYFVGRSMTKLDRMWGYLCENKDSSLVPWARTYYTFWRNSRDGQFRFQRAKDFNDVKLKYREKVRKYIRDDSPAIRTTVLQEFSEIVLIRKLRGNG